MADLALQISNNATGQLDAIVLAGATQLTLKVGEGAEFPATAGDNYFYVTLQMADGNWEIVKCTTRAGDVLSVIERNQDSSTGAAQEFAADDIVSLRPCSLVIEDIIAEIVTFQTELYAPVGTKMYFYEDDGDVPDGWTWDEAVADTLLSIKGGSDDYDAIGGTVVGDWDQGMHVHTGPSHRHTGGSVALSEANLPSHDHTLTTDGDHTHKLTALQSGEVTNPTAVGPNVGGSSVWANNHVQEDGDHTHTVGNTGSGTTHAHGNTSYSGTANTGNGQAVTTWRPEAANGVIATKD